MPTINAGGTPQTIALPEGQVLNVSGGAGTAGVVYRLNAALGGTNSLQSWTIGAVALASIGPYAGEQRFLVTCSAGSVDVTVMAAVLGAAQVMPNAALKLPGSSSEIPAWWKKAARTVMFLCDSIGAQGAHLPHTPKGRATRDLAPTLANINSGASGFVILMEGGPTLPAGNATLRFYAADSTMTLQAFGDTEGPRVLIGSAACMYALESGTAGNTLYIGCIPRLKPAVDKQDTFNVTGSFALRNNSGAIGFMCWTNALLGNPFDTVLAYAIPTIRAADWWAARDQWSGIYTDLTYIMLGTNDCLSLSAAQQAAIDVENMIKLRQSIGSQVVVSGLLPWTGGTTAQKAAFMYFNNAIREVAARLNADMADPYPYLVDPTSAGNFIAGMAGDGLHPSALGAYIWAKRCNLPILSKYAQNTRQRAFPGIAYDATTAPQGNLLVNGLLRGIAGVKSAGASGDAPDSWGVYRENGTTSTVVCTAPDSASPILRNDGKPGAYFRMALANNNPGHVHGEGWRFRPAALITTGYTAGKYYVIEGDLRVSGTGVQGVAAGIVASGNLGVALVARETVGFGMGNLDGDLVSIPYCSAPMMLEAGVTFLSVYFTISCVDNATSAILDISPMTLREVSAP